MKDKSFIDDDHIVFFISIIFEFFILQCLAQAIEKKLDGHEIMDSYMNPMNGDCIASKVNHFKSLKLNSNGSKTTE